MTTTETAAARYYVARQTGEVARAKTLAAAKAYANHLYDIGVIAPLVVLADSAETARATAARCWNGEITSRQARAGG